MRVLVCGGRDFNDRERLYEYLDVLRKSSGVGVIIHGDARGADSLADQWAHDRGIQVEVYPADWKKHGRSAGPIRNRKMLIHGHPDLVVAFPGGVGTADMKSIALAAGVKVVEP